MIFSALIPGRQNPIDRLVRPNLHWRSGSEIPAVIQDLTTRILNADPALTLSARALGLRHYFGWSQSQVAAEVARRGLDLSLGTLRNVETVGLAGGSHKRPKQTLSTLTAVADLYQVLPADLLAPILDADELPFLSYLHPRLPGIGRGYLDLVPELQHHQPPANRQSYASAKPAFEQSLKYLPQCTPGQYRCQAHDPVFAHFHFLEDVGVPLEIWVTGFEPTHGRLCGFFDGFSFAPGQRQLVPLAQHPHRLFLDVDFKTAPADEVFPHYFRPHQSEHL